MELFLFTSFFFSLFMFSSIDIDVYIFLTLYVCFNYWSTLQPLIPYHINLLQMLYRFSVLSLALFNKLLDINPKTVKSWLITSYEISALYGHSDLLVLTMRLSNIMMMSIISYSCHIIFLSCQPVAVAYFF